MTHLERVSALLGGLLVVVSAYLVSADRSERRSEAQREKVPVEQLAETLKQAWAGRHIP